MSMLQSMLLEFILDYITLTTYKGHNSDDKYYSTTYVEKEKNNLRKSQCHNQYS